MGSTIDLLIRVSAVVVLLALLIYVFFKLVVAAKKGGKGIQAFGATLMLFGLGNVQDPSNQNIQQAQQLKRKEEDDTGDPPASDG